jgi:hypothetical protein
MVRRAYSQGSLVEMLLPDGDKLWDPTLRQIDTTFDYMTPWWISSWRRWPGPIP